VTVTTIPHSAPYCGVLTEPIASALLMNRCSSPSVEPDHEGHSADSGRGRRAGSHLLLSAYCRMLIGPNYK
jgi:hypothetical protein